MRTREEQMAEAMELAGRAWRARKSRQDAQVLKMYDTFHAHMDADDPDGAFDYIAGLLDGGLPVEH